MDIAAGVVVVIGALLGVLLTALTLPGTWIAVLVAVGCQIWRPGMFSLWTLGAVVAIALAAEVFEVAASAAGARHTGGSKRAALGAVVGSIVGLILGSAVVPIIGSIVGAIVGAGLGALLVERHAEGKTWTHSAKVGSGAAAGRLVATVVKTALSFVIAVVLSVAAFVQ